MKRIKKYIFLLITFFTFICNVNAAGNPYPKYEESVFGGKIINCTWYAWQQAKDNMGVELPLWTYVQTWYSKAEKAGYSVGKEPKPNSIMVWNYGEGFGGHVAYVTAVDGTTVTYKEGGSPMTADGINTDSMTMDMMSSFLVGFIYLDKVPTPAPEVTTPKKTTPKKTTPSAKTPTTSKETPKVEEKKKSSNNYLSDLKITGIDLVFNKEVLEYNIEVENEIEEITITSKAEDSKATVKGNDTYKLEVGVNNFVVLVTAEDATTKEYKITVNRKEEKKIEENVPLEETEEQPRIDKKKMIAVAVVSVLAVLLIVVLMFVLINKSNKRRNSNDKKN